MFIHLGGEDIDAARRAQLDQDALRVMWNRASQGGVAYACLALGFTLASPLMGEGANLGVAPTVALWLLLIPHFTRLRPRDGLPLSDRWRRWFWAVILLRTSFFAVFIAVTITGGVTPLSVLMMVAVAGLMGRTHTFAPWPALLRTTLATLVVPSMVAALISGAWGVVLLAAALTAHTWVLGNAQHKEYWDGVFARARLEMSNDALAKAQQQARDLIEKNPDAIAIVRGSHIVYVNHAWAAAAQVPREELLGTRLDDLMGATERHALLEFVRSDERAGVREFRFQVKGAAETVWEILRSETLEYEGVPATMLVARDVTERNRLRSQLILSQRLASIGTLAAGVAHEINNPLTYVIANLDYTQSSLAEDAWNDDVRKELIAVLAEAREGADRVRRIVRDLKHFSRIEEGRLAPVDVRKVIELTLKMAAHELRHRARVETSLANVPRVLIDEARLGQVLLNLVVNAAQAIPDGRVEQNEVRVTTSVVGGRVVIEVADTGIGIPAEALPHIFDPFFTTKPVGVGTGLGLAIVHGILKSFDGEVAVSSTVGKGTRVTISLPVAARRQASSLPGPLSAGSRGGGRILVVDDDPAIADVLARLYSGRYELLVDHNPRDALHRLLSGEKFDLVLCDLMMPVMTGMELYALVSEIEPAMAERFVFMTGGAFTEGARTFLDRVPNPCIDKPFDLRTLRQIVLERVGVPAV